MSAFLRALLVATAAWLALLSPAAAATHKTDWTCWLHGESKVACTVLAAMDAAGAPAEAPARAVERMSGAELMQAIRNRPSATAGQLVFVPLIGVPFDDSMVEELVRSVLCGNRADCATHYHADLQQLIARAPELFADMIDPVLGGAVQ
jgi:hypothetical protein